LNLLARSGTGQPLSTYTHFIQGAEPPRELFVILLDNGRTRILADRQSRQSLYCIRCGACLNVCPVYRRAGGWAYGRVYPGPIGAVTTPHLVPLELSGELPFASSLCGACQEACPVKIDIPHQLLHLRHEAVTQPSPMQSRGERLLWRLWSWAMRGPRRYRIATWLGLHVGMRLARWSPWRPGQPGKWLHAWERGREMPDMPAQSFKAWWRNRKSLAPATPFSDESATRLPMSRNRVIRRVMNYGRPGRGRSQTTYSCISRTN